MNKGRTKGFTLIELLAVIIILGVLMLIAIPSVTEYISNSRKKTYIATAEQYIGATTIKVNNLDLPISDPDTTYYVPISCINLEKGGKSPYGEWTDAYIVVTFDGTKYDYYWTSLDASGNGVLLTYGNSLNNDSISTSVENIDLTVGVGGRNNIVLFDTDGSVLATSSASSTIADGSSLNEGTLAPYTNVSCFQYDTYDEELLIDWFGSIEEAEDYYNIEASQILNKVFIYDYNEYQSDGTTECPTDVVIPNRIGGINVVGIDYQAFASYSPTPGPIITSASLPNTIVIIGGEAFSTNELTGISIPTSVKYIGQRAFADNYLTTVTIPSTVSAITSGTFASNNLTSVTISEGVKTISYNSFENNNLTTVTLPSTLTFLCDEAFDPTVTINPTTPTWDYGCCNCDT